MIETSSAVVMECSETMFTIRERELEGRGGEGRGGGRQGRGEGRGGRSQGRGEGRKDEGSKADINSCTTFHRMSRSPRGSQRNMFAGRHMEWKYQQQ